MLSNVRSKLINLMYPVSSIMQIKENTQVPGTGMWIVNNTGTFVMQHIKMRDLVAVCFFDT